MGRMGGRPWIRQEGMERVGGPQGLIPPTATGGGQEGHEEGAGMGVGTGGDGTGLGRRAPPTQPCMPKLLEPIWNGIMTRTSCDF